VDDDGQTPEPVKRTQEFALVSPGKPSILIVDDDWDTCEAVKEALDDEGFDAVWVPNGEEGLRYLQEHPGTAAVLLDLMMPLLNGWTFVSRMRSIPELAELPIIVMTAAAPHWGYPVSHVLHKPVGKYQVVAAVRSVISRPEAACQK
jgi:DNA-binding response OmpR family regulator